jgi:23S rRNA (uridine2552-2'-O)-methyltransferase
MVAGMRTKRTGAPKNRWEDHYARRARQENYAARSVYKLQEMQQKFRIIRKGDRVLDLGCAPGSWLQLAAKLSGSGGLVAGVDLQKVAIDLPPHVRVLQADVAAVDDAWFADLGGGFNVVLSDMAPATTGSKVVDAARSVALCEAALAVALKALKPGGIFVCKIFQGPDAKAFENEVRRQFDTIKSYKPRSSRKASKEIYIVGAGKKYPG